MAMLYDYPDIRLDLLHSAEPCEPDTAQRVFVSYIDTSREYYAAQGYKQPYRWARHKDALFTPLTKPLAESRVGHVSPGRRPGRDPD